jgi:hypothetical protein
LTVLLSFVDNGSGFDGSSIIFVYKQRERGKERRGPKKKHRRQIILPFIPGFLEHLAECQFKNATPTFYKRRLFLKTDH